MDSYDTTDALACFTSIFKQYLQDSNCALDEFEKFVIDITHQVSAKAYGCALTHLDQMLFESKPKELKVKEMRHRRLATSIGDVSFKRRVYKDRYNNPVVLLDEALDLAHGTRISPYAKELLVDASAEVSYAKASCILERFGGSSVSAHAVMDILRQTGELLAEEDVSLAHDLYVNGVVPESETSAKEIFLESDGTYIRLQDGKCAEIKAMVGYSSKCCERTKTKRADPIRFGCIDTPDRFWPQAVAALGSRFDLTKIKRCISGFDGEGWCKSAGNYLKGDIMVEGHLDPFHLNRIIAACFDGDSEEKFQVMECIWMGKPKDACMLLESYCKGGLTKIADVSRVVTYITNNAEFITACPPSLGTMEAENQHLYKSRMASIPCGWSVRGASDMARLRSRKYSNRKIPKMTRDRSLSERRRNARKRNIEKALNQGHKMPLQSVGHGYEYPHNASTNTMRADIRYHAGLYADHWVREV